MLLRNCFEISNNPERIEFNKKNNFNKKAMYMEFFKTGDYSVFGFMPVHILNDLLEWKQEYEKLKQEQTEKEIAKTRQEMSSKHESVRKTPKRKN